MKNTLLTVTMPALLFVTSSAGAHALYNEEGKQLELTGKVELERDYSKDPGQHGDQSCLRLGLKGETPIDKQLKAFAALELGKALTADPIAARTAVIGVKSDQIGTLTYGRTLGVMNDVTEFTNVQPLFGGQALGDDSDTFGTSRATGLLQYRTSVVQGFQLALQHVDANALIDSNQKLKIKDKQLKKGNSTGYGVSLTHRMEMGVGFGIAYNSVGKHMHQKEHYSNDRRADMFAVGVKYEANDLHLAATYAQTRNQLLFSDKKLSAKTGRVKGPDEKGIYANQSDGFEVVAKYKLPFGLTPSIAYSQRNVQIKNDLYDTRVEDVRYVSVGASHKLTEQFSACADYKINLLKKEKSEAIGASTDHAFGISLTYNL